MLALPIFLHLASSQNRKKRHRYIGFVIREPERELSREEVKEAIRDKSLEIFGSRAREVGLRLTRFNGREGIVHCYHLYKDDVISLLRSIERIGNQRVKIETTGTSGTIKSLTKKYFGGRLKKEDDPDYMKRVSNRR
ncbi:MAG TPA: hypothetical protein ENI14_03145 [Thermoplasmatales archaeon]|nr:hypothetical protein [Thermoplasmatales archaeon]